MNLLKLKLALKNFKLEKEDLDLLFECNRDIEEHVRFKALKIQKILIKESQGFFVFILLQYFLEKESLLFETSLALKDECEEIRNFVNIF